MKWFCRDGVHTVPFGLVTLQKNNLSHLMYMLTYVHTCIHVRTVHMYTVHVHVVSNRIELYTHCH